MKEILIYEVEVIFSAVEFDRSGSLEFMVCKSDLLSSLVEIQEYLAGRNWHIREISATVNKTATGNSIREGLNVQRQRIEQDVERMERARERLRQGIKCE